MGKFNDVRGMINTNGCMEEVGGHRVLEERKVWGTMAKLWRENMISRKVKRELYERIVTPTVVYSSGRWSLSTQGEERNRNI